MYRWNDNKEAFVLPCTERAVNKCLASLLPEKMKTFKDTVHRVEVLAQHNLMLFKEADLYTFKNSYRVCDRISNSKRITMKPKFIFARLKLTLFTWNNMVANF